MGRHKVIMRPFWRSCAVGLAISVLMLSIYLANPKGYVQYFEALSLSPRFKYANRLLKPSDDIRIVAIDDQALVQLEREYGRYPWPRRVFADLVSVLKEAGAARIALDLHFPEALRVIQLPANSPALQEPAVQDDTQFADALRHAGNVYLPVVFDVMPGPYDMPAIQQAGRQIAQQAKPLSDQQFSQQVGLPLTLLGPGAYLRSRLANLLRERFWLTDDQLAQQTGFDVLAVRTWIGHIRRQVAMELVSAQVKSDHDVTIDSLCTALGSSAPEGTLINRDEIAWALNLIRMEHLVQPDLLPTPQGDLLALMQIQNPYQVQLPIEPLAQAAHGFGHVVFLRDSDGATRRLPMLIRWGDRIVPQIALRVATDLLDLRWDQAKVTPEKITVPGRQWTLQTPAGASPETLYTLWLDPTGQTLVNWTRPGDDWKTCFAPVPAGMVLEVSQARHKMRQNDNWLQTRLLRMVQLIQNSELPRYEQLKQQDRQIQAALDQPPPASQRKPLEKSLQDQLEKIRIAEKKIETACIDILNEQAAAIAQSTDPVDQEYRTLYKEIAQNTLAKQITESNAKLAEQAAWQLAQLRQRLAGKVVFIGCTAVALGDIVSTPIWEGSPGVMTHAQTLNAILQNRSIRPMADSVNASIVLLCCVLVTLITAWLGPRESLAAMLATCTAFTIVAMFVLFERYGIATALATPLIGMFVTWAMITAYRQLVEERAKRHFSRTLQQYTSPALAKRMAEDPDTVTRAETREVTCLFSDLKGFTSISERIGAEATQKVLNIYLERMTEVLDAREALINKFLGDGIFAFFNPAINPQADHAQRACLAALEAMAALEQLKHEPLGKDCHPLHMRIGLASGLAVVGNCGSERKFDYTCIGDTVNLASRLEGTNKTFGTGVLINARCKELAGPGLLCRHIGRILVVGRAAYEETHELVGRTDQIGSVQLEQIHCFEEAVRCFIAGNFTRAKAGFEQCLQHNATDAASQLYLGLCDAYAQVGPPDTWNGTVEMARK